MENRKLKTLNTVICVAIMLTIVSTIGHISNQQKEIKQLKNENFELKIQLENEKDMNTILHDKYNELATQLFIERSTPK